MAKPRLPMLKPRIRAADLTRVKVLPGLNNATGAPSWRAGKTTDQRGYTYRWRRFRADWLRRFPLCGDREGGPSGEHSACVRAGRVTPAVHVDHITPHRGDQAAFWRGPYQSLCAACHGAKTQREEGNR